MRGRSDTIVVVMPDIAIGINFQHAIEALTAELGARANVVLRFADPDPDRTVTAILKLRPLAVVDFGTVMGEHRERLALNGVLCVPDYRRPLRTGGLEVQDAIASIQVAELTRGRARSVVYASLADNRGDPFGPGRMAALERACAANGLEPPRRIEIAPDVPSAVAALSPLLAEPVGVAAYNDLVALTVLAAARQLDIPVPERLAVIGVDDTDVAHLWSPSLSTIAVDMRAIVHDAATRIFEQAGEALGLAALGEPDAAGIGPIVRFVAGEST